MTTRSTHDGHASAGPAGAPGDDEEPEADYGVLESYDPDREGVEEGARSRSGSTGEVRSSRPATSLGDVSCNSKKAANNPGSHTTSGVAHGTGTRSAPEPFRGGPADRGGLPEAGLQDGSLEVSPSIGASGSIRTSHASWTHALNSTASPNGSSKASDSTGFELLSSVSGASKSVEDLGTSVAGARHRLVGKQMGQLQQGLNELMHVGKGAPSGLDKSDTKRSSTSNKTKMPSQGTPFTSRGNFDYIINPPGELPRRSSRDREVPKAARQRSAAENASLSMNPYAAEKVNSVREFYEKEDAKQRAAPGRSVPLPARDRGVDRLGRKEERAGKGVPSHTRSLSLDPGDKPPKQNLQVQVYSFIELNPIT